MRLYDIAQEYNQLLQMVDAGELTAEDIKDTLESIGAEFDVKARNCVMVVRQFESDSAGIDKEIERLKMLQKSVDNSSERLLDYIKSGMVSVGKDKLDLGLFKLTLKAAAKAVEVTDEKKIPALYFREVPATKAVDKALIKSALSDGFAIEGAKLVDGKRALIIK